MSALSPSALAPPSFLWLVDTLPPDCRGCPAALAERSTRRATLRAIARLAMSRRFPRLHPEARATQRATLIADLTARAAPIAAKGKAALDDWLDGLSGDEMVVASSALYS